MATCPNCNNNIINGSEQCHFCGRIFHVTQHLVLKKEKKNQKVTAIQRVAAGTLDIVYMLLPMGMSLMFASEPISEMGLPALILKNWYIFAIFGALQLFLLVHDGQTVGKKIMRIAIVVHDTHEHPSAFQLIFLRCLIPVIPMIIPILGIALFGLNLAWGLGEEQRCLHDFIAGTEVVHE